MPGQSNHVEATVAVPAHVLTDQRSAICPSDRIACELESIGFAERLGPRLGHPLVASNACRDGGVDGGGGPSSLSRARAGQAVASDIRRKAAVAAVGIAAAVENGLPTISGPIIASDMFGRLVNALGPLVRQVKSLRNL